MVGGDDGYIGRIVWPSGGRPRLVDTCCDGFVWAEAGRFICWPWGEVVGGAGRGFDGERASEVQPGNWISPEGSGASPEDETGCCEEAVFLREVSRMARSPGPCSPQTLEVLAPQIRISRELVIKIMKNAATKIKK